MGSSYQGSMTWWIIVNAVSIQAGHLQLDMIGMNVTMGNANLGPIVILKWLDIMTLKSHVNSNVQKEFINTGLLFSY